MTIPTLEAMTAHQHHAAGAVYGALIGDAAGGVLEFLGRQPTKSEALKALDMPGGGVFDLAPGQFTDDGEMTVTLLAALASTSGRFDEDQVAKGYCDWARSDPFDIGIATRSALRGRRCPELSCRFESVDMIIMRPFWLVGLRDVGLLSRFSGRHSRVIS